MNARNSSDLELDATPPRITVMLRKVGRDETFPISATTAKVLARVLARRGPKATWLWPGTTGRAGVDTIDRATGECFTPCVSRSINLHIKTRAGQAEGVSLMATMRSVGHQRMQTTAGYCPAVSSEVEEGARVADQAITRNCEQPENRPDVSAKAIGARLRDERQRRKLSQREAAELASKVVETLISEGVEVGPTLVTAGGRRGLTQQMWAQWEREITSVEKIEIAARTLGMPFRDLAEGKR